MLRVRSVRGGPDRVFVSNAEAAGFARYEDNEQAWDDKAARDLLVRGALLAIPSPEQADIEGTIMQVSMPDGAMDFFGLEVEGEPATYLMPDAADVQESMAPSVEPPTTGLG